MRFKRIFILSFLAILLGLSIYYFYPTEKIPDEITIDKIIVIKSEHKLMAYSHGKLIVSYKIAIGRNPDGNKEYEGDGKTPEGLYTINSKNPNSDFYKNLGISYPNQQDIIRAKELKKPTGGDIKIHGIKNGQGYIGRFHRWNDWTNGCIALTNQEIDELYNHTPVGTAIEIRR
jgi:murein L,D-transpeptidase YafK